MTFVHCIVFPRCLQCHELDTSPVQSSIHVSVLCTTIDLTMYKQLGTCADVVFRFLGFYGPCSLMKKMNGWIIIQTVSNRVMGWSTRSKLICIALEYTRCFIKNEPRIFDYNSRISWSIFIIVQPLETRMNTPQPQPLT